MLEVIFKVPDHVLLPEDSVQRTRYTTKGHKKLLKEIENIKLEIQAVIPFPSFYYLNRF